MRRTSTAITVIILMVIALIATTVVGYHVGRKTRTASKKFKPTIVTVRVRMDRLQDVTRASCTIAQSYGHPIVPQPAPNSDISVITDRPFADGSLIRDGQKVLEVNGLPVFALSGLFQAYRPLGLGDSGRDVQQLQAGLERAGLLHKFRDGTLDPSTMQAIRLLYAGGGAAFPVDKIIQPSTIMYFAELPGALKTSNLDVGAPIDGGSVQLAVGRLGADCVLTPTQVEQMKAAHQLIIRQGSARCSVRSGSVGALITGSDGQLPQRHAAFSVPGSCSLEPGSGKLRIVVAAATSEGLVVPNSAVWQEASGQNVVSVRTGHRTINVAVNIEVTTDLESQVSVPGQGLTASSHVIIGKTGRGG